jgi:hypothetical protein
MNNEIRAVLVHLSMNMWEDCQPTHFKKDYLLERMYHNSLQVDEKCWNTTVQTMADNNIRPWMWSDVLRNCDEKKFASSVPLDVLQSNWYYGDKFTGLDPDSIPYRAIDIYPILDRLGYEQVPTGSNWNNDKNFAMTVKYCKEKISQDKLLGFMNCSWYPTMDAYRTRIINSIKQFSEI